MKNEHLIKIQTVLETNPYYQRKLFCRGYLITTNRNLTSGGYPFYENWHKWEIDDFIFWVHRDQHFFLYETHDNVFFLIGNAVNPFDNTIDENVLLKSLSTLGNARIEYINQWTGNFIVGWINNHSLFFLSDPCEMLFLSYGKIADHLYVSSHPQLVADICDLKKDSYIEELEKTRFFYKYGLFFPGDKTQFAELSRALTNHIYKYDKEFHAKRFYPNNELHECTSEAEYQQLLQKVSKILHGTMECAARKWRNAAISLTGGMDSKTTLAMTNGLYHNFQFYSYITMKGDIIDASAAHKIAEAVGLVHKVYRVSTDDLDFPDIGIVRLILSHNRGGYKANLNDVRKRAFLDNNKDFICEIKSWISEIARANYYKKFGLKKMPSRLSPRNMTSMYKIFLGNRKLVKKTDDIFKEFIQKSHFDAMPSGYDASDMYLWEFRYSAWGGMVITLEHSYSNEIFIPFNNRNLLDLMLRAPKEKRISDVFHEDLIRIGNPAISQTGITVTNWNETKIRMHFERIYFLLSSFFSYF